MFMIHDIKILPNGNTFTIIKCDNCNTNYTSEVSNRLATEELHHLNTNDKHIIWLN